MYFYETKGFDGRWRPNSSPRKPETEEKAGRSRLKIIGGQGPEIRSIRQVIHHYQHFTLGQLREHYSPDGRFQHV